MSLTEKTPGSAAAAFDARPKTAVLHQFTGIGDLVWHVRYFEAVAQHSRGGKVSVLAAPSTLARELIGHESWVDEVIDLDWRPRRAEARRGRHAGLAGMRRFAAELRERRFDRVVLYSGRFSRALLMRLSGIPVRLGYGTSWLTRRLLSGGPFIRGYSGSSVAAYQDATAFSIAHGFCSAALVPKLRAPAEAVQQMRRQLEALPRPLYAFTIGTSEAYKQWGGANFGALATRLLERGAGVVVLGGPSEDAVAAQIEAAVPLALRGNLRVMTRNSLLQSMACLSLADACIGNDTGLTNMAAAVDCPCLVLLGNRPPLDHDPLMTMMRADNLSRVTVDAVLENLQRQRSGTSPANPTLATATP